MTDQRTLSPDAMMSSWRRWSSASVHTFFFHAPRPPPLGASVSSSSFHKATTPVTVAASSSAHSLEKGEGWPEVRARSVAEVGAPSGFTLSFLTSISRAMAMGTTPGALVGGNGGAVGVAYTWGTHEATTASWSVAAMVLGCGTAHESTIIAVEGSMVVSGCAPSTTVNFAMWRQLGFSCDIFV